MQMIGFKLIPVTSDGSCQFSAIAFQFDNLLTSEVRAQAVQWMRDHPHSADNEPHWAFEKGFWETYISWEHYCDEMAKPATWGNEISLIAFAEATGCVIQVYSWQESGDFYYLPTTFKEGNNRVFLAHLPEVHYYAIAPGDNSLLIQLN